MDARTTIKLRVIVSHGDELQVFDVTTDDVDDDAVRRAMCAFVRELVRKRKHGFEYAAARLRVAINEKLKLHT
jgi:hypothetical protein